MGSKFMSLFIKQDEESKPVPAKVESKQANIVPAATLPPDTILPDSQFDAYFEEIMAKFNFPGPDYFEFMKAIKQIEAQPLLENQKFQVVFSGFAAQGVTADQLVDTGEKYIGLLQKDKVESFDTAVESSRAQIESVQTKIQELVQKNEELSKQIAENNVQIGSLNSELSNKQNKLAIKEASFIAAFNKMVNQTRNNIDLIKKYLNANASV